jgi:recombinational DNA repair ATPase RecF
MLNVARSERSRMVINKRIEKITLQRFRGATTMTEITFDPHKPLIFIFGENGSGKSSVVDAIDFVFNQAPGSLADRSSTRPKDHLPAIGYTAKDIKVELVCGGRTWSAQFSGAKILSSDVATLPVAHVLRRSRLTNLIDASPSERYKELQKFIDVGGVERSEQYLRDALREQARTLDEKTRTRVEAEAELEQFWIEEGKPGAPEMSALGWAAARSAADQLETRARLAQLQNLIDLLDRATQSHESFHRTEAEAAEKETQVLAAQNAAIAAAGLVSTEAWQLIAVLRDTRNYLARSTDLANCPVCEQPVIIENLKQRIDERLNAMTGLGELRDTLDTVSKSYDNAVAVRERDRKRAQDAVVSLGEALEKANVSILTSRSFAETSLPRLIEEAPALRAALVTTRDEAQKAVNQFNSINQFYRRVLECDAALSEAEMVRQGLERALEIVHAERIAFTQRVLADVRDETNRLYSVIHPGEPLGLDQLLLDEHRKGSLFQICSFEGHTDIVPQAYFSESHLDTLGFCLWLAIAKLSSAGDSVVVLDDVFTSVDSSHFTRILDLLMDECENFNQMIVTTHSRQWRDRYASQQIPQNKCSFVELQNWTRSTGIRSSRTPIHVETLREYLAATPFDRQVVASKAGILAESLLDWLTAVYECPLPRRRGGSYTLGDLFYGVKRLSKQLIIRRQGTVCNEMEELALQPVLEGINEKMWIRNQVGAHFNLSGAEIADTDVRDFACEVLKMAETLVCRKCNSLPQKAKGTHFSCSCAGTQMLPLKID